MRLRYPGRSIVDFDIAVDGRAQFRRPCKTRQAVPARLRIAAGSAANTPIRRLGPFCCARAASGQVVADPAIPAMNSRGRMPSPRLKTTPTFGPNCGELDQETTTTEMGIMDNCAAIIPGLRMSEVGQACRSCSSSTFLRISAVRPKADVHRQHRAPATRHRGRLDVITPPARSEAL